MITANEKIQLMRQYEMNPASAILTVADMLRKEMSGILDAKIEEIKKDLPNMRMAGHLVSIRGKDSSPEEVARIIIDTPGFLKTVKGEKGDSIQGIPGKDYILTVKDKQEIASSIPVPTVEKRIIEKTETIVKEQPIITELIKEKAVTDMPDIMAKKLNTLFEKVDFTVIRGLTDWMNKVTKSSRMSSVPTKAGGGMGNWVHQQFSVSSATTTVTLNYGVAANSNAILVRYQGQLLAHGIQYTISGKTITLLFTPEDDTYVDVTYVRK